MMTTGSASIKDQKTIINRLLNDEQVLVHINPACEGVELPQHLCENRSVTLRLSRYFRGALTVEEKGVSAELLFGKDYFTCVIPWNAIWGASSVRGEEYVWAEAAPEHVVDLMMTQQKESATGTTGTASKPRARRDSSHLRRVK